MQALRLHQQVARVRTAGAFLLPALPCTSTWAACWAHSRRAGHGSAPAKRWLQPTPPRRMAPTCCSKGDDRCVCVFKPKRRRAEQDPAFELPLGPATLSALASYFQVPPGRSSGISHGFAPSGNAARELAHTCVAGAPMGVARSAGRRPRCLLPWAVWSPIVSPRPAGPPSLRAGVGSHCWAGP